MTIPVNVASGISFNMICCQVTRQKYVKKIIARALPRTSHPTPSFSSRLANVQYVCAIKKIVFTYTVVHICYLNKVFLKWSEVSRLTSPIFLPPPSSLPHPLLSSSHLSPRKTLAGRRQHIDWQEGQMLTVRRDGDWPIGWRIRARKFGGWPTWR